MKKVLFWLLPLAVAAAGCNKMEIISTPTDDTSSTSPSTDTSSGEEGKETYEDSDFGRTVTITWTDAGAQVSGDVNSIATVSGGHVTVDNTGTTEKVKYILSGTSADGSLKLYSNNKQMLSLEGLSLSNPTGAAINNQGHKSCYVAVSGTNTLSDGSSAAYTTVKNAAGEEEDQKAVFFSEGQLLFSGDGNLTVTAANAQGKGGITSDDYIHIEGPAIRVTAGSSAGHGLRGKESVIMNAGTLDVAVTAAMKKGIASDSLVVFNGGTTTVKVTGGTAYDDEDQEYKASAGVKADQVFKMNDGTLTVTNSGQGGKGITGDAVAYFNGGTVSVTVTGSNYGSSSSGGWPGGGGGNTSSDNSKSAKGIKFDGDIHFAGSQVSVTAASHEAVEAKGTLEVTDGVLYAQSSDDAINSAKDMTLSGGFVCAYSTGNDGLDANGNCYIKGGVVYAIGARSPEVGVDANTEGGYKLYLTGGTLIAIGGLENGSSLSQSCYSTSTWSANTWYALTVGNTTVAFKTPASGGSGLVVSGASQPSLSSGVTVSNGTQIWNGMGVADGSVSGGQTVSLSAYSGGNAGGGGGGHGGGGGRPGGGW